MFLEFTVTRKRNLLHLRLPRQIHSHGYGIITLRLMSFIHGQINMMPFKAQINGALLLFGACYSSIVGAQWNSYVDSNSITEISYGYMEGLSTSTLSSKLKLVCLSPSSFTLYLDGRITNHIPISDIIITVDNLPSLSLVFEKTVLGYSVNDRVPEFWNLIGQMSAGSAIAIGTSKDDLHRYNLDGFTEAYLDTCGWLESVEKYKIYMDRYR